MTEIAGKYNLKRQFYNASFADALKTTRNIEIFKQTKEIIQNIDHFNKYIKLANKSTNSLPQIDTENLINIRPGLKTERSINLNKENISTNIQDKSFNIENFKKTQNFNRKNGSFHVRFDETAPQANHFNHLDMQKTAYNMETINTINKFNTVKNLPSLNLPRMDSLSNNFASTDLNQVKTQKDFGSSILLEYFFDNRETELEAIFDEVMANSYIMHKIEHLLHEKSENFTEILTKNYIKDNNKISINLTSLQFELKSVNDESNIFKFMIPFALLPIFYACDTKHFNSLIIAMFRFNKIQRTFETNYNNIYILLKEIIAEFKLDSNNRYMDDMNNNISKYYWITNTDNKDENLYELKIQFPEINVKIQKITETTADSDLIITQFVNKEFIASLLKSNMINWDLYTINQLGTIKAARQKILKFFSKKNSIFTSILSNIDTIDNTERYESPIARRSMKLKHALTSIKREPIKILNRNSTFISRKPSEEAESNERINTNHINQKEYLYFSTNFENINFVNRINGFEIKLGSVKDQFTFNLKQSQSLFNIFNKFSNFETQIRKLLIHQNSTTSFNYEILEHLDINLLKNVENKDIKTNNYDLTVKFPNLTRFYLKLNNSADLFEEESLLLNTITIANLFESEFDNWNMILSQDKALNAETNRIILSPEVKKPALIVRNSIIRRGSVNVNNTKGLSFNSSLIGLRKPSLNPLNMNSPAKTRKSYFQTLGINSNNAN